ncbi:hypothetical protein [Sulfurimonas sp.]|uniref:hypothetical protein n=1 Tax=Sulfurimonas sp. TaxID=2022749 RepID=UPI0019E57E10|nr:hypothetical protein [Sulfurimonas sp.]MBE0513689.1 hypothetical protein [Sulfurimonas sp.]
MKFLSIIYLIIILSQCMFGNDEYFKSVLALEEIRLKAMYSKEARLERELVQLDQERENIHKKYDKKRKLLDEKVNADIARIKVKANMGKKDDNGGYLKEPYSPSPAKISKSNNINHSNTTKMTKKEEQKYLKNKYENTPTLYVKDRIIYDILKIDYFRGDKNKIIIEGREQSYMFSYKDLDNAKFYNATEELLQRFNLLVKNSKVELSTTTENKGSNR